MVSKSPLIIIPKIPCAITKTSLSLKKMNKLIPMFDLVIIYHDPPIKNNLKRGHKSKEHRKLINMLKILRVVGDFKIKYVIKVEIFFQIKVYLF